MWDLMQRRKVQTVKAVQVSAQGSEISEADETRKRQGVCPCAPRELPGRRGPRLGFCSHKEQENEQVETTYRSIDFSTTSGIVILP